MTDPRAPDETRADATDQSAGHPEAAARETRPMIERVGLALVAVVVIAVFGALAAASFAAGEPFMALMAAIGAAMTAWAGGRTLLRG